MLSSLRSLWRTEAAFAEAVIVLATSVAGLITLPASARADGGPDGLAKVSCGKGAGCSLSVSSRKVTRHRGPVSAGPSDSNGPSTGEGLSDMARRFGADDTACAAMRPLAAICTEMRAAGLFDEHGDGARVVTVPPVVVARRAAARLGLPSPVIRFSPSGTQLVGLPTWLWIDRSVWGSRSATASVPGVSVTARARPQRVVWELGDGFRVTCRGPGTVWRAGMPAGSASPTCGHTYRAASLSRPGGAYRVSARVSWAITWSGTGGSGSLPAMSTSSSARLRVTESQALNDRAAGAAPGSWPPNVGVDHRARSQALLPQVLRVGERAVQGRV